MISSINFSPCFRPWMFLRFLASFFFLLTTSFAHIFVGAQGGGAYGTTTHVYMDPLGKAKKDFSKLLFGGGVCGGYLTTPDGGKMLVGGEAYGNFYSGEVIGDLITEGGVTEGKFAFKHRMAMGISGIVGGWINPKMALYAKAGMELNQFQIQYKDLTFQTLKNETYNKKAYVVVPGMGAVFKVTPLFWIGAEYTHPIYAKMSLRDAKELQNGALRGYEITPKEHQGMLKIRKFF
jgi:hypothetical protein